MESLLNANSDFSSDESDEDYVPVGAVGDVSDSASDKTSDDERQDEDAGKPRRKAASKKRRKQKESLNKSPNCDKYETDKTEKSSLSEEAEKKRIADLYQDFLKDVKPLKKVDTSDESTSLQKQKTVTITEVFDFAGEAVTVTKEVNINSQEVKDLNTKPLASEDLNTKSSVSEDLETKSSVGEAASSKASEEPPRRAGVKRPMGLTSVLSLLDKKKKMSTLQKSQHDWNRFKKDQGIEEELQTFNRGKGGFIEKQAFLQRSDVRQFEIEKSLRQSRRANM